MNVRIRVCRDCCCGTWAKHPDVDHDALLEGLVEGTRGHADVSVTGCLLACDRSNVVVVSPGPHWFGDVLTPEAVTDLVSWVVAGGATAALPDSLERRRIRAQPRAAAMIDGDASART